jgi:1-acyl-sn-glycerol-3-phosphate acyltransferase
VKPLILLRLARLVLHMLFGMALCAWLFPWLGRAARERHVRRWSRHLLAMCNVRVEHAQEAGRALPRAMVVANHVSWLDIFVINTVHPCRFVAKAEIRAWPLLGWLSERAGTVFIARGQRRELRHVFQGLVEHLAAGERIAFFPQGTTTLQGESLPFHPNLFEAAIDARVPVQPFALAYLDGAGRAHPAVEYGADVTFVQSMIAVLGAGQITARLCCLPAIDSCGAHRRELALAAQTAVGAALGAQQAGRAAQA